MDEVYGNNYNWSRKPLHWRQIELPIDKCGKGECIVRTSIIVVEIIISRVNTVFDRY